MRFGLNLLLFDGRVTPAVLRLFPRIKQIGFDGVEIPIFDPPSVPADKIRRAAERCGLALTASGALPPGARFYGKNAAARRKAARYLRGAIDVTRDMGATLLCGPLYKAVGDTDQSLPLQRQRAETAPALRELAAHAEEAGVALALEPLNRFETNFLNTAEQGIAFCRAVRSPAVGLLLDTFHMHIEEKDTPSAILAAAQAGFLFHFHASENDRGVAGTGQVHWAEVARALAASGYDRWCVLESFSQKVAEIRTAVSCWRPFYPSTEVFCREGIAFAKRAFKRK